MITKVSAIDLFCGVGGLTHGLISAGIPVIAGFDINATCEYAYTKNNRANFINQDVGEISSRDINNLYPKGHIKILVGCPPCQPFSTHTNKKKDREKKKEWGLLYDFSNLVEGVKPEIVSMENVPNLIKKEIFKDFEGNLKSLGYNVFWKSVYCPDYGIPQTRRRLVLLASTLGEIELIPKTHNPSKYITVRDTIGNLECIDDGETSKKDSLHKACEFSSLNKERIQQSKPGGTWEDWEEEIRCPCHNKDSGKSYQAVYGRMEWDEPGPTITTQFYRYGTGRFGHPELDRALSLREGALLQTFPPHFDFIDPKQQMSFLKIGAHIGNAVPVRLGIVIGQSIMRHLEDT